MFVYKRLSGIKAVQTLSRVNRIARGKTDTFILDFVNTKEEIEEAFKLYYECTVLDEEINVNLIYDTRVVMRDFRLYNDDDIEKFIKIFSKQAKQTEKDLGKLASVFKLIINRYMDLDEKLKLEFYKLEQTFKGSISLRPTVEDKTLENVKSINVVGKAPDEDDLLQNIIDNVNEKYQGEFGDGHKVMMGTLYKNIKDNKKLKKYAKKNDEEIFNKSIFPKIFNKIAQECYMDQMEAFSKLFEDKRFYSSIMDFMGTVIYRDLKNG